MELKDIENIQRLSETFTAVSIYDFLSILKNRYKFTDKRIDRIIRHELYYIWSDWDEIIKDMLSEKDIYLSDTKYSEMREYFIILLESTGVYFTISDSYIVQLLFEAYSSNAD